MKKFVFSHIFFVIGMLLTLSLLWPLVAAPYFTHHDDVQIIRLYEMNKCIKDGQIPCRWVPDLGGLYGYPIFNYYAPLPYYFGELFYLITGSLIISSKIMFATPFIGAYIFMFLFARKFWGNLGGALSAIFYSFAPYHAMDLYVRGAMGELWALTVFPALLWSLVRLRESSKVSNLILCAFFVAVLILSHNLSALIFFPIILIWIFFLYFKGKNKKFIIYSSLAIFLGILLSSFYLLPMALEKNLVHVDTTTYGYFSYTEHFKGFKKLILDRTWGWGSSVREVPGGEKDGLSFQIGWVHLLGWVLSLYLAVKRWKTKRWLSYTILLSSIFISFSIYMVNPRSEFIWKAIEPLKFLQFPWRFLMIIIFFISFIAGSIGLFRNKGIIIILIIAVSVLNFFYFRPEKFIQVSDKELLSDQNWDKQIKRSIFDYLPIYAKEPPRDLATSRYQILTGDSEIIDFKEGTNWIKFRAETKSHSIIRLSQYYFPDWQIFIDGKKVEVDYKSSGLGLMTITLGTGDHYIEAKLYDTPVRSIANLITIITFIFLMLLFLLQFQRIKKWILYYRKRID